MAPCTYFFLFFSFKSLLLIRSSPHLCITSQSMSPRHSSLSSIWTYVLNCPKLNPHLVRLKLGCLISAWPFLPAFQLWQWKTCQVYGAWNIDINCDLLLSLSLFFSQLCNSDVSFVMVSTYSTFNATTFIRASAYL